MTLFNHDFACDFYNNHASALNLGYVSIPFIFPIQTEPKFIRHDLETINEQQRFQQVTDESENYFNFPIFQLCYQQIKKR
jgi:hypothetical protein